MFSQAESLRKAPQCAETLESKTNDRIKYCYSSFELIHINPLHNLAKKHDKTITKEFVSNWLKSQSTQQQTTKMVKKKEYKPIYSEDYYAYQIDLTFLNKYKNSNDVIYVLFTSININRRYLYAQYGENL